MLNSSILLTFLWIFCLPLWADSVRIIDDPKEALELR